MDYRYYYIAINYINLNVFLGKEIVATTGLLGLEDCSIPQSGYVLLKKYINRYKYTIN